MGYLRIFITLSVRLSGNGEEGSVGFKLPSISQAGDEFLSGESSCNLFVVVFRFSLKLRISGQRLSTLSCISFINALTLSKWCLTDGSGGTTNLGIPADFHACLSGCWYASGFR